MHSLTDRDTAVKKILIITYYWPPAGGPGVQRWLKFSKYLPEFGYDPIIITVDPEKAEYPIKDHTLEQDVRVGQNVYRTNCSGLYEYYKKLIKRWESLLSIAKQTANYKANYKYGVYQIMQELDTFQEVQKGLTIEKKYDNPDLHNNIIRLNKDVKKYYDELIEPLLFEYELIK